MCTIVYDLSSAARAIASLRYRPMNTADERGLNSKPYISRHIKAQAPVALTLGRVRWLIAVCDRSAVKRKIPTVPTGTETSPTVRSCRSAVAQAVSIRLPAAAARVRVRVKSCGICGGQSGTGAGFLPVLQFPLPLIHSTDCSTIITIYHPGLVQ
jgi:hypothetical protein